MSSPAASVSAPSEADTQAAIDLAEAWLKRAIDLQTPQERRQQAELERMVASPEDKTTLVEMTDQAFRTRTPWRVADQLAHILDVQGIPRFFSPIDQTLLRGFQSFGGYLPGVAVPLVKEKMRRETANVILPAEPATLSTHLRARNRDGIRMNVNFLGEAILGEAEASRRLKKYLAALADPDIHCISVKASTLYSQITPISHRHCAEVLRDRLVRLFREAILWPTPGPHAGEAAKFVYLDMEEYRDMRLTAEALTKALDEPGLETARAGIALQAYLPDSFPVLNDLIHWAQARSARGASPLTVRVVKGANLEMERVEASILGLPQAPYTDKLDTDANFKRMLRRLIHPEVASSVRVGVASHNLFDVALAMIWAREAGTLHAIQFEMLEGMANHQRRALQEQVPDMLLYAPVCAQEDFLNAIGYLIRRLDENTGPANFLRHAFRLTPGSPTWDRLAEDFREACRRVPQVSTEPRRQQDRRQPPVQPAAANDWSEYVNEPDTDWSLPANLAWSESILADWHPRHGTVAATLLRDGDALPSITTVPLEVASVETGESLTGRSLDPSRPGTVIARFFEATAADVDIAIGIAKADPTGWRTLDFETRHDILRGAAQFMRERRGDLIGAAIAEAGKTITEADPEVSEAIDFIEFYPLTAKRFFTSEPSANRPSASQGLRARGRGVVVVVSPWNFPIAIPCGGIAAALAAGNTVILKPSSDAPFVAAMVCQCFWDAGVPRDVLRWFPCRDVATAQRLVSHPSVDVVILTGGTETARAMLRSRHGIELLAETGGKNATIVTALSDRDLAIKHVVHSAFGHSGQKCSATSLLLLEQELYEDHGFRSALADAVQSLRVGSCWDPSHRVGPLIRPPRGPLLRAIEHLEPGESWLVEPQISPDNPNLVSPGVKWGVSPGSFTHLTEFFGPILGVIPFRSLDEAIAIVHATGYGLTSGLQSLDDREQEQWRESLRAGNLYINRGTTGAIVLRQPFGGMGASAFGPGLKAGGPNYVVPLLDFSEVPVGNDSEHQTLVNPITASTGTPADDESRWSAGGPASEAIRGSVNEPLPEPLAELLAAIHAPESELAFLLDALDVRRLTTAITSIARATSEEFNRDHDSVRLIGQENVRRYLAVPQLRVRLSPQDSVCDALIAAMSAVAVDCRAVFSHREGECEHLVKTVGLATESWAGRIEWVEESDESLAEAVRDGHVDRLRILSRTPEPPILSQACLERFVPIVRQPVIANGWIEPLWCLQEQSLSHDYHRYGNLGRRTFAT